MSKTNSQNPSITSDKDHQMTKDKDFAQHTLATQTKTNVTIGSSTTLISSAGGHSSQIPRPPPTISNVPTNQNNGVDTKSKSLSVAPKSVSKSSSKISSQDQTDDDDADDGGVSPKKIAKKKQDVEDKKKKKDESKQKKQSTTTQHLVDEDEDGGVVDLKPKIKQTKTKKKSVIPACFHHVDEDEDEDGGVSKEKILAAEKKKQEAVEKKKNAQQKKTPKKIDTDDDDDGGVSKQPESNKKKSTKTATIEIPKQKEDTDEDDDGGRVVKAYATVKMIIPPKQPILGNQSRKKKPSADDDIDDGVMKKSKHEKNTASTSHDTIRKIVLKTSDTTENTKSKKSINKDRFDATPADDERSVPKVTNGSSTPVRQSSSQNAVHLLRTLSYREAQQRSPPTVSQRPKIPFALSRQTNANNQDGDKHDSQVTSKRTQFRLSDRLSSIIDTIKSLTNYSSKRFAIKSLSKEADSNDVNMKTDEEKERIRRRRLARNRWYLAYTLIHNPHLFDLRKKVESRLIFVRSQQSTSIDQQLFTTVTTNQKLATLTSAVESQTLRTRRLTIKAATSQQVQPSTTLHPISMPATHEQPLSPVEKYIAIRAQMIYNVDCQQTTTSRSLSLSQTLAIDAALQQENISPSLFQPVPDSSPSVDASPSASTSAVGNSSILCTQMSHDQHMQTWRDNESKRIHKKQPHSYIYGPPPQQSLTNTVATTTILTPQILPTTTTTINDKTAQDSTMPVVQLASKVEQV